MGKGYLIDSNAIIDFFNKSLPENGKKLLFNTTPIISIITFIELFGNKKPLKMKLFSLKGFVK